MNIKISLGLIIAIVVGVVIYFIVKHHREHEAAKRAAAANNPQVTGGVTVAVTGKEADANAVDNVNTDMLCRLHSMFCENTGWIGGATA